MTTLLLVEDDLENLRCLEELFNRFGYIVIARSDPQSALAAVRDGATVDLVITDFRMPGMDGLEFLVLLKQMQPSVPVVMLTGYSDIETYLKSLSLGVFEYVNKPVRARELQRIVKCALASSDYAGKSLEATVSASK